MTKREKELLEALKSIWKAHCVCVSNGGGYSGPGKRHLEPAIYAASKLIPLEQRA